MLPSRTVVFRPTANGGHAARPAVGPGSSRPQVGHVVVLRHVGQRVGAAACDRDAGDAGPSRRARRCRGSRQRWLGNGRAIRVWHRQWRWRGEPGDVADPVGRLGSLRRRRPSRRRADRNAAAEVLQHARDRRVEDSLRARCRAGCAGRGGVVGRAAVARGARRHRRWPGGRAVGADRRDEGRAGARPRGTARHGCGWAARHFGAVGVDVVRRTGAGEAGCARGHVRYRRGAGRARDRLVGVACRRSLIGTRRSIDHEVGDGGERAGRLDEPRPRAHGRAGGTRSHTHRGCRCRRRAGGLDIAIARRRRNRSATGDRDVAGQVVARAGRVDVTAVDRGARCADRARSSGSRQRGAADRDVLVASRGGLVRAGRAGRHGNRDVAVGTDRAHEVRCRPDGCTGCAGQYPDRRRRCRGTSAGDVVGRAAVGDPGNTGGHRRGRHDGLRAGRVDPVRRTVVGGAEGARGHRRRRHGVGGAGYCEIAVARNRQDVGAGGRRREENRIVRIGTRGLNIVWRRADRRSRHACSHACWRRCGRRAALGVVVVGPGTEGRRATGRRDRGARRDGVHGAGRVEERAVDGRTCSTDGRARRRRGRGRDAGDPDPAVARGGGLVRADRRARDIHVRRVDALCANGRDVAGRSAGRGTDRAGCARRRSRCVGGAGRRDVVGRAAVAVAAARDRHVGRDRNVGAGRGDVGRRPAAGSARRARAHEGRRRRGAGAGRGDVARPGALRDARRAGGHGCDGADGAVTADGDNVVGRARRRGSDRAAGDRPQGRDLAGAAADTSARRA